MLRGMSVACGSLAGRVGSFVEWHRNGRGPEILPVFHHGCRIRCWYWPPEGDGSCRLVCQDRSLQECSIRQSRVQAGASISVSSEASFSRSESELQAQGLEVHLALDDLNLDQLNTLFVKVGFPRRDKEKLVRALENTLSLIWLRELKSEQLVAFARATGDDVFNAVIWDVVVDPGYQGVGLGKVVMERLMFELVTKGISNIALYAEPNVVSFYKPLGFVPDPDGVRAMAFSRSRR